MNCLPWSGDTDLGGERRAASSDDDAIPRKGPQIMPWPAWQSEHARIARSGRQLVQQDARPLNQPDGDEEVTCSGVCAERALKLVQG